MSFVIGVAIGAFLMTMFLSSEDDKEPRIEKCIFSGPAPEGYDSWSDWLESPVKKYAHLRSITEDEYDLHINPETL